MKTQRPSSFICAPCPQYAAIPETKLVFPVNYLIRGAYLVTIAACRDCHTPQDAHGQPLPGMDFAGGLIFDGPWGRVASANITSGISYYDAEIFKQAFQTGVVKARPLNQIMP